MINLSATLLVKFIDILREVLKGASDALGTRSNDRRPRPALVFIFNEEVTELTVVALVVRIEDDVTVLRFVIGSDAMVLDSESDAGDLELSELSLEGEGGETSTGASSTMVR